MVERLSGIHATLGSMLSAGTLLPQTKPKPSITFQEDPDGSSGSQEECMRGVGWCPYLPLQTTLKILDQVSRENQLTDFSKKYF